MHIETNNPSGTSHERIVAIIGFYLFKLLGPIFSAGAIYLGYHLFILGVTGQASLSIESKTINGQLLNAAPGLFFAVGGIAGLITSIVKGVNVKHTSKLPGIGK